MTVEHTEHNNAPVTALSHPGGLATIKGLGPETSQLPSPKGSGVPTCPQGPVTLDTIRQAIRHIGASSTVSMMKCQKGSVPYRGTVLVAHQSHTQATNTWVKHSHMHVSSMLE